MNNKTIAIIGAMDCEVERLIALLNNKQKINKRNLYIYKGEYLNHKLIVAKSGVGKVNSAMCTQYIIDNFNPDFIINTGIAGGISQELSVGDIVIGKELIQYDFDTSALGYAKGYMCTGINKDKATKYYSDDKLILEFEKALSTSNTEIKTHQGIIATGDTFVATIEKKQEIKNIFNATACEMEGCAIAQTSNANDIPCLIVRAISDLADGSAVKSLDIFEKEMAEVSASTIETLLKSI